MPEIAITIPQAVRDASDESDKVLTEAEGSGETPEGAPAEPKAEEVQEPAEAPEEKVAEVQPQLTEDYLQKYRTIAGKYNAEVPRLQGQVQSLRQALEDAQRRQAVEAAKPPEAPKVEGPKRYLKKEEVDEYGDSLLDLQSRMAKGVAEDVVGGEIAALRQELQRVQSQIARTSGETFWDRVERVVPNARAINETDPDWHGFLGTVDPVTGSSYRKLGLEAIQSGDSSRLVAIFRVFAAVSGGSTEKEEEGSSEQAAPRAVPPVKPTGTRTVSQAPKQTAVAGTISDSAVQKFYNDVTRGVYRNREKEQAARELEIETAANEGRIVPG